MMETRGEGAQERVIVVEEAHRDAPEDEGRRSRGLLENLHLPRVAQQGDEALRDELLGAEEIEVPRAPVAEVKGQTGAAGQVEGPDLADPAQ